MDESANTVAIKLVEVINKLEAIAPGLWEEITGYTWWQALIPLFTLPLMLLICCIATLKLYKIAIAAKNEERTIAASMATIVACFGVIFAFVEFLVHVAVALPILVHPQAAAVKQLLGQ